MRMEEVFIGLSGLLILLIKQIFLSGASSKGQRPYNKKSQYQTGEYSFELLDKVVQETLKTYSLPFLPLATPHKWKVSP